MGKLKKDTHVAVVAVVYHKGKVLFLKRNKEPLGWNPPSGSLHEGEDPVHGVVREAKEETGLGIEVLAPLVTWSGKLPMGFIVSISYLCKLSRDQGVELNHEHSEYRWLSLDELTDPPVDTPFDTADWKEKILRFKDLL